MSLRKHQRKRYNTNAGLVNVSSNKPAVNQVWHLVNSVIEDINEAMIPVLEHFGVQKGVDISVFCREYEDVTSFKETFVDCTPKKGLTEDIRGSNSDEVQIAKEHSVDQVSEFLLDLGGNTMHAIVEEEVEGRNQNDNSQKITENNSNFYYKSDKANKVYTKFENILTFNHLQLMLERTLEGMQCLSLGKIDVGSTSLDRKQNHCLKDGSLNTR